MKFIVHRQQHQLFSIGVVGIFMNRKNLIVLRWRMS